MSPDDPTHASDARPAGDAVSQGDVTRLLEAVRGGERDALDRLLPIVYEELRAVAGRQLGRERPDHTLHATALVHETYVKLAGGGGVDAVDRAHFLAIAARAMRQVLVDHARRRMAAKRGGDWAVTTLSDGHNAVEFRPEEMLALDRALERLEPRQRQVVEYRFFAGMEEAEIGEVLEVSERTVRRDWVKARAWLYRELYPEPES
jgi:RNA polymerase sigma factor (TIGR02999 family)